MQAKNQTKAAQPANKGKGATKAAQPAAPVAGNMAATLQALAAPVTAQPAAPVAGKVASAALVAAALANGCAAPGATARAHTWGAGGASVGNSAKLPAGIFSVTAKGTAYNPKPGYNATAWQHITSTLASNPKATAADLAAAVGHGGAGNVRYHVTAGRLAVSK